LFGAPYNRLEHYMVQTVQRTRFESFMTTAMLS
jgi:hypothetical protein